MEISAEILGFDAAAGTVEVCWNNLLSLNHTLPPDFSAASTQSDLEAFLREVTPVEELHRLQQLPQRNLKESVLSQLVGAVLPLGSVEVESAAAIQSVPNDGVEILR